MASEAFQVTQKSLLEQCSPRTHPPVLERCRSPLASQRQEARHKGKGRTELV